MNTSMIKLQSALLVTLMLMASCGPGPTATSPSTTPTPDPSASAQAAAVDQRLTSLEQQIAKLSQQVGVISASTPAGLAASIDPATVKDFTVSPSTVEVAVGAETTLDQVVVTQNNDQSTTLKAFNTFSFSSIDPAVASVDSNGKIKGLKEGTTIVSIKMGSVTKTFGVLVKAAGATPSPTPTPSDSPSPSPSPTAASSGGIESMSVAPSSFSIKVGSSDFISSIAVVLSDGEQGVISNRTNVSFSSSDSSIATVDTGGVILAKAIGTCTITITYSGVSTTATVTVVDINS